MGTMGERELVLGVGLTSATDNGLDREGRDGLGEREDGEVAGRTNAVSSLCVTIAPRTKNGDGAAAAIEFTWGAIIVESQMY